MVEKKIKEKQKYNYRQIIKCEKCGMVQETPGLCEKCKNDTFVVVLKLQESD